LGEVRRIFNLFQGTLDFLMLAMHVNERVLALGIGVKG
jgi:hypothetical protein